MTLRSKHSVELNSKIDDLYNMFRAVRWILQYVGPNYKGQTEVKWKSRIPSNEFWVTFNFDKPMNEESISELNRISEYEINLHINLENSTPKIKTLKSLGLNCLSFII